ncbi:hypothetical protein FGADI_13510 [Fusarium gaditjirri]|uniref:Amino acid permease/ SLC12A domain-containing protein n=1 Tax=Fusarium gaditjirri TaxID=282569 RepID=A0A8H4WL00_9HYPO|nr:hypothetical protein FGADI_13510 [Fusarium gaditjirri]
MVLSPPDSNTRTESSSPGVLQDVSTPQLRKNRSFISVLGMSFAITAVPYGLGGPLMSSIYGGGQLPMFIGVLADVVLQGAVAVSLGELSFRYPTSSGVYYWSYRLTENKRYQHAMAYFTGWVWLISNWTIALFVNYGFASLIVATVTVYQPKWTATANETFSTAKEGRHSTSYGLTHYDTSISGWGEFSFFIGLLPPAYALSAIGMVMSMTEECSKPDIEVPRAISMWFPIGGASMLAFILPICFTLPPLEDILAAPYGQALPFIINTFTGSKPLSLALLIMVLMVTLFCSISIMTAASRCTWALSKDGMLPFSRI